MSETTLAYLELRPSSFGVGKSVDNLALRARQFCRALKVGKSFSDLALL